MEKIKKEDIINREFNKLFDQKIMLEFEIALQKELNPDEKSAQKPLRFDSQGRPTSWEQITRKEYIEIKETQLEDINLKLKILEKI